MCNCIERIEKMLNDKMIENNPNAEIVEEVELQNKTLLLGSGIIMPYNPALGRYKQGNRIRKFEVSALYTYCPFCGEKYDK